MLNNTPFSGVDVPHFIYHLPTEDHCGCFQVLAIMNTFSSTSFYVDIFSVHLGKYLGL